MTIPMLFADAVARPQDCFVSLDAAKVSIPAADIAVIKMRSPPF